MAISLLNLYKRVWAGREYTNGIPVDGTMLSKMDSEAADTIEAVNRLNLLMRQITTVAGTLRYSLTNQQSFVATAAQTSFVVTTYDNVNDIVVAYTDSAAGGNLSMIPVASVVKTDATHVTLPAQTLNAKVVIQVFNVGNGTTQLASITTGQGASLVGIEDAAAKITATTVEGALAEIAANLSSSAYLGGILTSSNFILRTGAVAFTANQSMGSFKLTSLANGTAATDAVNLGQLQAIAATAADFLSTYLRLDGGNSPTADVSWGSKKITNLAGAVSGADAVNLTQVSGLIATQSNPTNLAVNGSLSVWQNGTSFAATATAQKTADCWSYFKTGIIVRTVVQDTADVPTVAQAGTVFPASMKATVTTAMPAPGAGDYEYLSLKLEGFRFAPIQQKSFVINFWAKDAVTGVHSVTASNSGSDRSYAGEYTIATANTWQLCTVTMTASPTAGTWNYTTSLGLDLRFALVSGATFMGAPNTWLSSNIFASTNQVNGAGTIGNVFAIAGVDIYPGTAARSFSYRPFDEEFTLCRRYSWKTFAYNVVPAQNTANLTGVLAYRVTVAGTASGASVHIRNPVEMRGSPTITTYSTNAASNAWWNANLVAASGAATQPTFDVNGATFSNAQVAGDLVQHVCYLHAYMDARL
jgi:hypothetical protein